MMPRSQGGVVDTTLMVYGTRNLRVVDASIIPLIVGAPVISFLLSFLPVMTMLTLSSHDTAAEHSL